jgi:8-oxo-dGTP pyrophosphatase MutT (NUDIX family)
MIKTRRVAVRAIILHDGKLLCVRQKRYEGRPTHDANDYWCVPGGGVDVGEALLPALKREIIEELGVEPIVGNLLYVQQFGHEDTEQMELFFHVTNAEDFLNLDLSKSSHGAIEIETVEFIDPKNHHVLPKFLTIEPLAQIQGPTKFFDYLN